MTKPMIPTTAPLRSSGLAASGEPGLFACLANVASAPAKTATASAMKTSTSTKYQIAERPMKRRGFAR